MANADLFPIGLGRFNVVSLRADPPTENTAGVTYKVGILRHADHLTLVGIVTVMGEDARGQVVMDGDAMWRESDFVTPIAQMEEDELGKIVSQSFAIHTLYDAAAMALRQSFGILGREQPVDAITPEPEVEFLRLPKDDVDAPDDVASDAAP